MALTLLVLAAGLGSRYGGLKQIDPVGPASETLLDYAVFDAVRAGFERVVFVIRRDFEAQFRAQIGARYTGRIAVDYAFQALDDLPVGHRPPAGREKPWGTGHAVWCARAALGADRFAVINADDFYGRAAFAALAHFLHAVPSSPATFAIVGYRLDRTLSEHGLVSRGICEVAGDHTLRGITERTGIDRAQVGAHAGALLRGDETVSMNCWGFTAALGSALERELATFLDAQGQEARAEFYLPAAVSAMIGRGEVSVRVLEAGDATWFGVTHRDDKPRVQAALAALVAAGAYPAPLF